MSPRACCIAQRLGTYPGAQHAVRLDERVIFRRSEITRALYRDVFFHVSDVLSVSHGSRRLRRCHRHRRIDVTAPGSCQIAVGICR